MIQLWRRIFVHYGLSVTVSDIFPVCIEAEIGDDPVKPPSGSGSLSADEPDSVNELLHSCELNAAVLNHPDP